MRSKRPYTLQWLYQASLELSEFDRQFPEFSGTQNNFLSTFLLYTKTFDRMMWVLVYTVQSEYI